MVAGACSGIISALLWFRIGQADGWRSTRPFAWVALTAAGFCAADAAIVLDLPDRWYVLSQHVGLAFGAAHAMSWVVWFASMDGGRPLARWERGLVGGALVLMLGCLIPGAVVTSTVRPYVVEWLGVTYHTPQPTTFGFLAFLFFIATMWAVAVAAFRRWPQTWEGRYPVASVLVLSVLATLDTLSTAGYLNLPLMLDVGLLVTIAGFAFLYLDRFIRDARRLSLLRAELERDVMERTMELTATQGQLARSEVLAAIGRLAAGVAHQVNNPTAVVMANLTYLTGELDTTGALPPDARQSLQDATEGTARIARIVKQLSEATQGVATHEIAITDVVLGDAMANSLSSQVVTGRVPVEVESSALVARADEQLLSQVLKHLVANAVEAASERPGGDGHVWLTAVACHPHVEVRVRDNGPGVPTDQQQRLFELFTSTRMARKGTGLGLAVAAGLAKAQAGAIRLVESSGEGTTFAVVLPAASALDTGQLPVRPERAAAGPALLRA